MVIQRSTFLKIVTVEDSSAIVERIKSMVTLVPNVSFIGNSGTVPSAIELIRLNKPDVVILDINLRSVDGKNGIYLLNFLRTTYPEMVIIMLTNLTDIRYQVLCMDFGADFFFDKSNDFDKIPITLTEIMKTKRLTF